MMREINEANDVITTVHVKIKSLNRFLSIRTNCTNDKAKEDDDEED